MKELEMTPEQAIAFQWALTQHYDSVAARYCKALAKYIVDSRAEPENKPLTQEELQSMNNERVWDDYNQDYALVWVHSNHKVTLTFKNGGMAGGEVGIVRKIYREKPVSE